MQTTMAFVAAQPARVAAPKASRRSAVVVRASAEESRRAVLGGLLAGVAALTASTANAAVYNDFVDDRKAKANGFDIVYEARELDLPQAVRDGLAQARSDIEGTKKRIAESERRLDSDLEDVIKKNYWTEGREQLRRQVGTLRFDINTLAENLPKAAKKDALAAKKEFFAVVDDLDFAMRVKDEAKALKALEKAKASLDNVLSKVL